MKTFAIATNNISIPKGRMATLVNAEGKNSSVTPHASLDISFAGILNRKKGTAATPAPLSNTNNLPTNDPDITAGPIGKPVAADTPSKAKQTKGLPILSQSGDPVGGTADSRRSDVSIWIDETSFSALTDTAFTKAPNPAMITPSIALVFQEGKVASSPATAEGESPVIQAVPDSRIASSSGKPWLAIPLQGAIKPDHGISSESRLRQDQAPAASNILKEETHSPGKTPVPEQILKTRFTSILAMTEEMDTACMNPAAQQKVASAIPGKAVDSEQMENPALQSAPVKTEKTDAATMNPAALQKVGPGTPDNSAKPEQTAKTGLETETADADRKVRHSFTKDGRPSTESKFMDRVAHLLAQKEGTPAPENILSQVRRTILSTRHDQPSALSPKDSAPAAATQNPAASVDTDRDLASKPGFLDRAESTVEMPDRAVTMKEGEAMVSGHDSNIDKNGSPILARAANPTERASMPFHVESLSTTLLQETKAPPADNQAGNRTQAIINQIIDAKQAMTSDFGRIRIVLSPPNLGAVDLEIVVRHERVEVMMTADNSSVQQVLQSRADDIRIALQRHDLKIEAFQVFLQDQAANQHQSQGGALFEQHRENHAPHDFKDSNAIPSPAVSLTQESGPEKGRVSIFV